MRSVFLFLLLLNILYALWQLQDGRADQALYEQADAPLEVIPDAVNTDTVLSDNRVRQVDEVSQTVLCVYLGAFERAAEAEQVRQRLLALSIQSSVQARDVKDAADYWLVMPVQGGQAAAMSRLAGLQEQGVDSFLITQGRLANNISLGVFGREDIALARQAQLEEQGYVVQVEVLDKTHSEYLVQVDSSARRLVDQPLLARLREDFPGLQHQFLPCR